MPPERFVMTNILIVAAIFIIVLIVAVLFIAQQLYTIQKVVAARPKTLVEKMTSSSIGPLDNDRFKEIMMSTVSENPLGLEPFTEGSGAGSEMGLDGDIGESPEEEFFAEIILPTGQPLDLEGKNLKIIYAEYLSAKSLNPFDEEPDFKLGVAYLKFNQHEKAQGQFQRVIDVKPDFPGIYYYLGEAFRYNGQFYEAMKAYKKSWEMEIHASQEAQKSEAPHPQGGAS